MSPTYLYKAISRICDASKNQNGVFDAKFVKERKEPNKIYNDKKKALEDNKVKANKTITKWEMMGAKRKQDAFEFMWLELLRPGDILHSNARIKSIEASSRVRNK